MCRLCEVLYILRCFKPFLTTAPLRCPCNVCTCSWSWIWSGISGFADQLTARSVLDLVGWFDEGWQLLSKLQIWVPWQLIYHCNKHHQYPPSMLPGRHISFPLGGFGRVDNGHLISNAKGWVISRDKPWYQLTTCCSFTPMRTNALSISLLEEASVAG